MKRNLTPEDVEKICSFVDHCDWFERNRKGVCVVGDIIDNTNKKENP